MMNSAPSSGGARLIVPLSERGERDRIWATGTVAETVRAFEWRDHPLGPIDLWDEELVFSLNLILNARFPMFLTWGSGDWLLYNDAYAPILAEKPDSLGRSLAEVFEEAWAEIGAPFEGARSGRAAFFEDFSVSLARDEVLTETWWSFSYSPVFTASGHVGGVFGVVYETTRRLLAERTSRANEAALIQITNVTPNLLWRCDSRGHITWMNQRMQAHVGAAASGSAFWDDAVHPADIAPARAAHELSMRNGTPFECQQRLRNAAGEYRWSLVRAEQTLDENGRVTGWFGSATDIQDWRSAADAVTERDERLREFSSTEQTLMWLGDVRTQHIEALNPKVMVAWSLGDGKSVSWSEWMKVIHPDDRLQMAGQFDRMAAGQVVQGKFRTQAPGGAVNWFYATGFPVPCDDGAVKRVGGVIVNITRAVDRRIYLIDPAQKSQNERSHALVRRNFKVRVFDSVAAFHRVADDLLPGCVILTALKAFEDSLQAGARLKTNVARLPWIVIGDFDRHPDQVVKLMKLGATDILPAGDFDAVATAVCGALSLLQTVQETPRTSSDARQKLDRLSNREREVLQGIIAGGTNKTIAEALCLSPRTVETHRSHLMDRLGVRSVAELMTLASAAEPRG